MSARGPQDESVGLLVADGNERARAAYRTYRERAVQSYISRVCALEQISAATVDAVFQSLYAEPQLTGVRDDDALDVLLLEVTRRHAADCAGSAAAPAPTGWGRLLQGIGRDSACEAVPRLLAAREARRLREDDAALLERHLARCPRCASLAGRFHRAEQVFQVRLSQYPLPQKRPEDPPARGAAAPAPPAAAARPAGPVPRPAPKQPAGPAPAPAAAAAGPDEPTAAGQPQPAARPPSREAPAATAPPDRDATRPLPVLTRAAGRHDLRRAALVAVAIAVVGIGFWLFIRATAGPAPPGAPPATEAPRFDTSAVSLAILDAAGDPKAAELASDRLGAAGFRIADDGGRADEEVRFTTVVFARKDPVARRQALAVKRKLLPLRSVLQQPVSAAELDRLGDGADVVVLAGPDLVEPPKQG